MCGIIAVNSHVNATCTINKSVKSIKHRGPDSTGFYISENGDCQLGHVGYQS